MSRRQFKKDDLPEFNARHRDYIECLLRRKNYLLKKLENNESYSLDMDTREHNALKWVLRDILNVPDIRNVT